MSDLIINGIQLKDEYISKNKAAEIFGKSPVTIQKLIDKFKVPNGPMRINVTESGNTRLNAFDLKKLYDTNFAWRGDGDPQDENVYEDHHNPDFEDGEDEDLVPFDTQAQTGPTLPNKARYHYRILKDEKTVDTWLQDPTNEKLHENFAPGSYRIRKIDTLNGNLTVESRMVKIESDPDNPSNLDTYFNDLSKFQSLVQGMTGNRSGGDGESEGITKVMLQLMMKNMESNQQFLTTLLLQKLGEKTGDGNNILETMKLMGVIRDSGFFGGGSDDDSLAGIAKGFSEIIAPLLSGNGAAQYPAETQPMLKRPSPRIDRPDPISQIQKDQPAAAPEAYYNSQSQEQKIEPVLPRTID